MIATGSAAAQSGGWLLVRAAIDDGIAKHDEHTLTVVVIAYLALNAFGWLCQLALIRGLASVGQGIVLGLRRDLFDHLTSLSLRYFSEQRAGWIIARVTSDVDAISDALSQGLPTLVSNVVLLPTTVIVLFVVDWRLGLVAMVILPPTLVLTRWFQRKSAVAQLEVRNRIAAVTAQVAESVSGMAIVQAFNRERQFQGQFDELNGENRTANVYAQKLFSVFFPSIELLGAISTCAVLVVGSRLLDRRLAHHRHADHRDLPAAARVPAAAGALGRVRPAAGGRRGDGQGELGARHRAGDRRPPRRPPDRPDRGRHRPRRRQLRLRRHRRPARHRDPRAGGRVRRARRPDRRRQVDPREADRPLLRPADRRRCASTAPTCARCELASYRRQLGVVLQDPFLFSGTIADNVRFARPEATDDEVRETAAAIGLDRLLGRLHGGLEHEVREGGAGLSAGERQLISIARALLADPRILILDEATSNIDRPTEVAIERALDRLLHGRSSVIIAHRLATVRRADRVLVVERGRIVQSGTPAELQVAEGPVPAPGRHPRRRPSGRRRRRAGAAPRRCLHAAADRRTIRPQLVSIGNEAGGWAVEQHHGTESYYVLGEGLLTESGGRPRADARAGGRGADRAVSVLADGAVRRRRPDRRGHPPQARRGDDDRDEPRVARSRRASPTSASSSTTT